MFTLFFARCSYLYAALISLLLALIIGGTPLYSAPASTHADITFNTRPTLPEGAHVLGALPADTHLQLVVVFTLNNRDGLAAFLHPQRHLRTIRRRSILTPPQFATLFGLTSAKEKRVIAYLRRFGLHIVHTYHDHLLLDIAGTARQVVAAFGARLIRYRDRHGHVYYANAGPPHLPKTLARLISAIIGLRNDMPLYHTPMPRETLLPTRPRRFSFKSIKIPPAPSNLLTPAQIQAAYDMTPIYGQVFTSTNGVSVTAEITGAGQTIALYELSPYNQADITVYDAAFSIAAPNPVNIPVDGGATDSFDGKGAAEVAMDIELIQALAPGARILVYNGPSVQDSNNSTSVDDIYARIINDDRAQVLSTSWGQCEALQQADQPADLMLLHTLFAQAVAEGMTVLAASGDLGSYDCVSQDNRTPNTSKQGVDYPASDPYVIAVGGTTLTFNKDKRIASETGWAGSGGGQSAYFSQPSWQVGQGITNTGKRMVPDVALNAETSYAVWTANAWDPVNGTSAGTPVWAALLALTNQARYVNNAIQGDGVLTPCWPLPGLGDIHPELYQLGPTSAFRDITSGASNGIGSPGPGWDYVTGWGVPNAYVFLRSLIAMPALASPTTGQCPVSMSPPQSPSTGTLTPTLPITMTAISAGAASKPGKGPSLLIRVTPGQVRSGADVLLELQAAVGKGHKARFELHYPNRRLQWVWSTTDSHGTAMAHVHIPRLLLQHHTWIVRLRASVQEHGHTLVVWTMFQVR